MPRLLEPKVVSIAIEDNELKSLFSDAAAEIEHILAAKRAVFERYLDTRVRWFRMQFLREAEATNSLNMKYLDYLRVYKPHLVPQEYRSTTGTGGNARSACPPSALRVIKTLKRVATRSTVKKVTAANAINTIAPRTPAKVLLPRIRPKVQTENVSKTTFSRAHDRPRRAAAMLASIKLANLSPVGRKKATKRRN
ncbi:hypothetical protein Aperf_G00000099728 [Anoplocephala perfoliata]